MYSTIVEGGYRDLPHTRAVSRRDFDSLCDSTQCLPVTPSSGPAANVQHANHTHVTTIVHPGFFLLMMIRRRRSRSLVVAIAAPIMTVRVRGEKKKEKIHCIYPNPTEVRVVIIAVRSGAALLLLLL